MLIRAKPVPHAAFAVEGSLFYYYPFLKPLQPFWENINISKEKLVWFLKSNKKMLFSIIVANYNNSQYLVELISSVKNQTYEKWELIIVDDYSSDDSRSILQLYHTDPKIKIIYHKKNRGAASAFRTGAENASGEVIGMLGADDALVPEAIKVMVDAHVQHPNASLICSNLFQCDEALNVTAVLDTYRSPDTWGSLIKDPSVGSFATFKRTCYERTEGFNPFFKKALDHDIYLKLEEQGEVIYIDKALYLYRANPIGISQNSNWFEATMYSLVSRQHAYRRRQQIPSIVNLDKKEYYELIKTWHVRKSILERSRKNYLQAIYYYVKSKALAALLR